MRCADDGTACFFATDVARAFTACASTACACSRAAYANHSELRGDATAESWYRAKTALLFVPSKGSRQKRLDVARGASVIQQRLRVAVTSNQAATDVLPLQRCSVLSY